MNMIDKTFPIAEKLVARSVELTTQLQQLLINEAECLKQGSNRDVLNSIIQHKQPIVTEINQFSKQISQILASENLSNDQKGIDNYFEHADTLNIATNNIRHNWNEITRIAKHCKQLNLQNGAAIDILQKHTERSLNILKGKPLIANTYGKDGSTKSEQCSRAIISV